MNSRPLVVFAMLLALTLPGCVIGNHDFADRGAGPPDVAQLDKSLQTTLSDPGDGRSLGDFSWYPLIALNAQVYGPSHPRMPKGTTLGEVYGYGPLFLIGGAESHSYDENSQLYERQQETSVLWGLWRSKYTGVRVPSGWRSEYQSSLLFGLLGGRPAVFYSTELPPGADSQ